MAVCEHCGNAYHKSVQVIAARPPWRLASSGPDQCQLVRAAHEESRFGVALSIKQFLIGLKLDWVSPSPA
jgi:hypothetical protein